MTTRSEHWIELALETDGEMAEAISDAIYPYVEGGVVLEQLNYSDRIADRWEDEGASGPVIVRAYLPCDDTLEERRAHVERALRCLNLIRPAPQPTYRPIAQADWAEAWKASFKPVRIGQRILICPSWMPGEARPDDLVLTLDPGLAFGTGLHPTTQLCAAAVEAYVQAGARVLDVGTGSGILSILAARLGASEVLGVDTDEEAVRAARENVLRNDVSAQVRIELGSHEHAKGVYDVVVANILAGVIHRLLQEGLASKGRTFIFSGILDTQTSEIVSAMRQSGLQLVEQKQIADWICLVATSNQPYAAKLTKPA
ncbi:MAG: 50S ribosomal protein L11 methyltransferase [Anaerolineae bacterium]|nr:50S ribosomal protein L11 methyltransferase [Thermoflexales bacterium]MDW8408572.1 50S ribosomal protein L11 methyltransferase [Anaerolineae bacterium]